MSPTGPDSDRRGSRLAAPRNIKILRPPGTEAPDFDVPVAARVRFGLVRTRGFRCADLGHIRPRHHVVSPISGAGNTDASGISR
ncbi:hypothetical protein GCM10027068_11630 [Prescottella soli]